MLKIKYMDRRKVGAYADDLKIATRGESIRAVEIYRNAAEEIAKLIHSLSKAAEQTWGIKHEAIATIKRCNSITAIIWGPRMDRSNEL